MNPQNNLGNDVPLNQNANFPYESTGRGPLMLSNIIQNNVINNNNLNQNAEQINLNKANNLYNNPGQNNAFQGAQINKTKGQPTPTNPQNQYNNQKLINKDNNEIDRFGDDNDHQLDHFTDLDMNNNNENVENKNNQINGENPINDLGGFSLFDENNKKYYNNNGASIPQNSIQNKEETNKINPFSNIQNQQMNQNLGSNMNINPNEQNNQNKLDDLDKNAFSMPPNQNENKEDDRNVFSMPPNQNENQEDDKNVFSMPPNQNEKPQNDMNNQNQIQDPNSINIIKNENKGYVLGNFGQNAIDKNILSMPEQFNDQNQNPINNNEMKFSQQDIKNDNNNQNNNDINQNNIQNINDNKNNLNNNNINENIPKNPVLNIINNNNNLNEKEQENNQNNMNKGINNNVNEINNNAALNNFSNNQINQNLINNNNNINDSNNKMNIQNMNNVNQNQIHNMQMQMGNINNNNLNDINNINGKNPFASPSNQNIQINPDQNNQNQNINPEPPKDKNNNKKKFLFSDYKIVAKTGLKNLHNTSYLNSVLQLLGCIRELAKYFINPNNEKAFVDNINSAPLTFVIYRLFTHLYPEEEKPQREIYKPDTLFQVLGKNNQVYKSNEERNPNDLILFILNRIHKEMNLIRSTYLISVNHLNRQEVISNSLNSFMKSNKSIISNLFIWFELKTQTCSQCKKSFYYFNNYETLDLDISNININSLNNTPLTINNILQMQKDKIQKGFCESCKAYCSMNVNVEFYSTPNYFIFSLNREGNGNKNLLNIPFYIEENINLEQFIIEKQCFSKFDLQGIVSISLNEKNKYVCFGKCPVDNNWYLYNDDKVDSYNINNILDLHNKNFAYIPCILLYKYSK